MAYYNTCNAPSPWVLGGTLLFHVVGLYHRHMSSLSRITKPLAILVILAIISLSYRGLAPQFSPFLNSDFAIHILMAHDLQLPDDLYYWGQDRLGSLVPIISHFWLKLVPLAPIEMVGIVNYGMALVAYLCFASFLRDAASWILLAAAWFLPLRFYVEFLEIGPPYAAQMACLGLATIGLRWLLHRWPMVPHWQRQIVIMLTIFSMAMSLWMSDFSIIYLVVVMGAIAHHLFLRLSPQQRRSTYPWHWVDVITASIAGLMGWGFLQLAKASAANAHIYTKFNTFGQFIDLISRMGQSFTRHLRFEVPIIWFSQAAWLMLIASLYALYLLYRHRRPIFNSTQFRHPVEAAQDGPIETEQRKAIASPIPAIFWLGSWGLANGLGMMALLVANWVYQPDHIPQRYFVVIYILGWLSILFIGEQVPKRSRIILGCLLLPLTVVNAMSLPPRAFANQYRPRIEYLAELQSLAPASFIGNYWHSYVLCSANPEALHCTSQDPRGKKRCPKGKGQPYKTTYEIGSVVRCQRCVDNVLNAPMIYLVKDEWLDRFPKRIEQFGYCLERSGKPIEIAQHTIAPYRKLE